jgi:hypothetical protein
MLVVRGQPGLQPPHRIPELPMSALNMPGLPVATPVPHAVRYAVLADAEPGLLARLLVPFARRDLTPDRFEARRMGDAIRVEIALEAMPGEMVHLVEGNLRQVVGVRSVDGEAAPMRAAA